MKRILGEGEPETHINPHRVPKDGALAAIATSPSLAQRGNTLEPLPGSPRKGVSPDRQGSGAIAAHQPRAPPDHNAQLVPQLLQQQLAMLDHQVSQGVGEVAALRQQCLLAARDAAGSRAQVHSLTELLHGLQQSVAELQARLAPCRPACCASWHALGLLSATRATNSEQVHGYRWSLRHTGKDACKHSCRVRFV
jgi:hypothetical protein